MWECEKDSLLSIDSYSFYVLNILRQESRTLRSLRLHQKMRQWEKTGWTFSRSMYRWLWCMKMLPVKKKKKTAICWLCLTALLSLWALCTHARLNALWKSGLTSRLINVNIPQQTAHRWGLIYEHKLPVWVSLYFISRFVNGMSLVMELQSQIPAGTPSPPSCVESEGQRMIWALKWEIICCKSLKQCNCSVSQLSFLFPGPQFYSC